MALKIRNGLAADIATTVLEEAEIVYATDTKKVFVGDGVTAGGTDVSNIAEAYNLADDLTPSLGGDLDLNSNNITGTGDIDVTGDVTITRNGVNPSTIAIDGNITAIELTGNVIGNLTGDVTGDVTGNVGGNVLGNVTGNLTGDVIGNLTGNVTGGVTGDVTGDVTGNLTGDVTGDVIGNLNGNVTGGVTGNLSGNVIADDTSTLLDAGSKIFNNGILSINEDRIDTQSSAVIIRNAVSTENAFLSILVPKAGDAIVVDTLGPNGSTLDNFLNNPELMGEVAGISFQVKHSSVTTPLIPTAGAIQAATGGGSFDPSEDDVITGSLIVHSVDNNTTPSNGNIPGKISMITSEGDIDFTNLHIMSFDSQGQLAVNQKDAQATVDVNGVMRLAPQTAAPSTPVEGMIAVADGSSWDPASKGAGSYPAYYNGSTWTALF